MLTTALVVQIDAIVSAAWRPTTIDDTSPVINASGESGKKAAAAAPPLLAFCTGTPRVYFWSPSLPSVALYSSAGEGREGADGLDNRGGKISWADVPPSTASSNYPVSASASASGNASVTGGSVLGGSKKGAGGGGGGGSLAGKKEKEQSSDKENSSNSGIVFFSTQGTQLAVTSLSWSKDGKRLLLRGREGCVTCDVPVNMGMSMEDNVTDAVDNWEMSSIPLMGRS